ncbi:MAG: phosphoribosyl-AMP cyclohydrolase [Pseudomonadota bacterium]|nr:phosphoribosyl-AMP cyclohydrolase [Pseudomonadota bacterium]
MNPFPAPGSTAEVERGDRLTPRFDEHGLIAAIAQHVDTGEVLMLAWMNAEALARTLESGEAWYWSRSRGELWRKGAGSGQVQRVAEVRIDCDQDAVLLRVSPAGDGGACHLGQRSCFHRRVGRDGSGEPGLIRD